MMVKTALLTIQGVSNKQGYLYSHIASDPFFVKRYDKIIDVGTDEIFAFKKPWYLKPLGKLGSSIDDVFDYLLRTDERIQTCRLVREAIRSAQYDGYSTDIIAHSLGTALTLTCGPNGAKEPVMVNNVYMLGSPIGFKYLMMRRKVESHCERYGHNFIAKKINYSYSENDPVSCRLTGRGMAIVEARSMETPSVYHTNTSHSAREYIDHLKENIVV